VSTITELGTISIPELIAPHPHNVPSVFNPNEAFNAGIPTFQSLSESIRRGIGRIVVYSGLPFNVRPAVELTVITPDPTVVTPAVEENEGPKTD
jgi:hypothetical protein